jgi:hypothetical protein
MRMRTAIVLVAAAAATLMATGAAAFELVELQTQIQLDSWDVYGGTPQAYQYTVHRAIRDYAALRLGAGLPYQIELAYNDDKIGGSSDETWTGLLNYERPVDGWGWGLQVPEQYADRSGYGSLWYEGVSAYGYYNLDTDARVGGYANVNYAWSDVLGIDDKVSWAVGAFGSYPLKVSDAVQITPAAVFTHYATGQDGFQDSDIFSLGGGVDYAVTPGVTLQAKLFYNTDRTNDLVDDTYWDWEIGVSYKPADTWEIRASAGTTESFSQFDRTTFRISAGFQF